MRAFRGLGESCVLRLRHLLLDVLEEGLKALREGGPVGERGEFRVDGAVALVHVLHVDLRDKAYRGGNLGVLGASNNLELVHAPLMSGLQLIIMTLIIK